MEQTGQQLMETQNKRLRTMNLLMIVTLILIAVMTVLMLRMTASVGTELQGTLRSVDELAVSISSISRQLDDPQMIQDLKTALTDIQMMANSLETVYSQLSDADVAGMVKQFSEFVQTTGETLTGAAEGLSAINLQELNQTIQDLKTLLTPLAVLAGGSR